MTFYELSATNSQGATFTLTTTMHGLVDLVAALQQAAARYGAAEPGPAYQDFRLPGVVIEEAVAGHFGHLGKVNLDWFDGTRHWQTSGTVLSEDSARAGEWTVVWGDY